MTRMCITCQLMSQTQAQDGNIGLRALNSGAPDMLSSFVRAATGDSGGVTNANVSAATGSQVSTLSRYLTHGFWSDWNDTARAFNKQAGSDLRVDITGLTAAGQTLARAALAEYASLLGFNVVETTTNVDIDFEDTNEQQYTAYSFSLVSNTNLGDNVYAINKSYVVIGTNWINSSMGDTIGSYGYQTYLHEIGHALGLGHAGFYNGSATYPGGATFSYDSWQASVMSYFSQSENTTINASLAYVTSLQWADIEAIKSLYGLSGTTRTGDTIYGYNSTAGASYSMSTPGAYGTAGRISFSIVDDGGIDTLDGSGSSAAQVLDLRAGTYSSIGGFVENVFIYTNAIIEKALGGSAGDLFRSGSGNNEMHGNGGDDVFEVGHYNASTGGTDVVYGGIGTDTVKFGLGLASYVVELVGDFLNFTYQGMTSVYKDVETYVLGGTSLTRDEVLAYLAPVDIESDGSVALTSTPGQYFLNDGSGDIGITRYGSAIGPSSIANWQIIHVEDDPSTGGFKLLWESSTGTYTTWQLSATGVFQSGGSSLVDPQTLETFFEADIDGDGSIGPATPTPDPAPTGPTTIETDGSVTLTSTSSQYFVNAGGGDIGITRSGTAIGPSSIANWQIIHAEDDPSTGGFKVLWESSTGTYTTWQLSATGIFQSGGSSLVDPQTLETFFEADIDGDGSIGPPGADLRLTAPDGSANSNGVPVSRTFGIDTDIINDDEELWSVFDTNDWL